MPRAIPLMLATLIGLAVSCSAGPTASVAPSSEVSAPPGLAQPQRAAEPPNGEPAGGMDDAPPPVWWTPLPAISRDELTEADQAAVKDCLAAHRIVEPDATDDELFAGAECLGSRRAFGQEIRVYMHLMREYPTSPHVPAVHVALGRRYEQLDVRPRAVELYRSYLKMFAGREDARSLGQRGVCLARSLGDTATVDAMLSELERAYGLGDFVVPPSAALEQLCAGLVPIAR